MKKSVITALVALAVLAGQAQVHYRLEGTIGNASLNTKLLLNQSMSTMYMVNAPIDTIDVVNGKLIPVEGTLDEPGSFSLMSITKDDEKEPEIVSPLFIIEEGTHCIHFNPEKEEYKAPDTPLNKAWTEFLNTAMPLLYGDSVEQQRLDSVMRSTLSRHNDDIIGLQSIAALLTHVERKIVASWIDLLSPRIKAGNVKHEMELGLSAIGVNMETQDILSPAVGEKFVDFEVVYDGKTTRLSDYVGNGKYVLVDFWASWCGPCRKEIPNIIATYNKYKEKGLEVVGIAAWDKPAESLEAIKTDGVPYPQILNTQEIATNAYNIKAIPHIILFSPDGIVLARGLHGEMIGQKLAEIFE